MKNIVETIFKKLKKRKTETGIFLVSLIVLNALLTAYIAELKQNENLLQLYFLNVGQGDSELVILPGGTKILIDAGPSNKKVLQELSKILSPFDRTIDLVSYSHAQQDHMGSLPEVIKNYKTSALISNGVGNTIGAYKALVENVKRQNLPSIILSRGDRIKYKESTIYVLHSASAARSDVPNIAASQSPAAGGEDIGPPNIDINETSLVLLLESASTTALFTGDIGKATERLLLKSDFHNIDILKVAHHGSKYSSDKEFLQATSPKIAVIEVGKNSYGHPAGTTLQQLQHYNIKTLRTDTDGTVKITSDGKNMRISSIK